MLETSLLCFTVCNITVLKLTYIEYPLKSILLSNYVNINKMRSNYYSQCWFITTLETLNVVSLHRNTFNENVMHGWQIFEWSLQNQGQVLWSRDCSRYCMVVLCTYNHLFLPLGLFSTDENYLHFKVNLLSLLSHWGNITRSLCIWQVESDDVMNGNSMNN